ncbi:MAG: cation transporter [Actinomycetota bacterium]
MAAKSKVRPSTTALVPLTFKVSGMTCASCVSTIERTLNKIPKVSASVNFASETVHVLAPAEMNPKVIISAVKGAGYGAYAITDTRQAALNNRKSATSLIIAAILTIPLVVISMVMQWHPSIDAWIDNFLEDLNLHSLTNSPTYWLVILLSAPVVLIVGWPIHRAAARNLLHPTMDTLISLGSLSALGWSIYSNIAGVGDVYAEACCHRCHLCHSWTLSRNKGKAPGK